MKTSPEILNKEPRPNIPKMKIKKIGSFDGDRPVGDWVFDGAGHPNSIANYISQDWALFGGYTIDELREIARKNKAKYEGKEELR